MRKRYSNNNSINYRFRLQDVWKFSVEKFRAKKDLKTQIPYTKERKISAIQANNTTTSYTWIGHSTFLIQLQGLNILTDPVWAKRMGFEKRLRSPGMKIDELPLIDIVLISHGHYDHLEFSTLTKLKGKPTFYVPIGLKQSFIKRGLTNVKEASWWDSFKHEEVLLHFVPAHHWVRRHPFDFNRSHWGGWILQTENDCLYFVGDTAYFEGFYEIRNRFQINTVFMPIGDYEPEWLCHTSHISPEKAIQAYLDIGATHFIPMHYGTFRLSIDTGPEALERLQKEWRRLKLPPEQLKVLKIGESYFYDDM
ncbi:MBL fold metallo-hydrolase [Halalkalibacter urbisdiaboli]|uniref:MBL fold metallo-hydrolase n=1 Tax=Halalkalibacter urbisdiaboli TaxID=1960589 RepID=UPI000B44C5AD|nr:MBL fold metallo-hydrolase [Halalkalibacter urbisdiaboli]